MHFVIDYDKPNISKILFISTFLNNVSLLFGLYEITWYLHDDFVYGVTEKTGKNRMWIVLTITAHSGSLYGH